MSLNNMMRAAILAGLMTTAVCANSQKVYRWEQLYQEQMQDEDDAPEWEDIYERMCELEDNPINLNQATRDELEQIPLLTYQQVMDIMEYKEKFGHIYTYNEMAGLESIDLTTLQILQCVTNLGEDGKSGWPKLSTLLKQSRHTLMLTASIPFYKRKGQQDDSYLGDPLRHNFRYSMKAGNKIEAGLVGAKDAGEPFFSHQNGKGYDFYSFYVALHHIGPLSTLIVGRYRAQFGMGLVMNTGFSFGKMGALANLDRQQNNVRPYSSTQQSRYLQGAAATIDLTHALRLSVVASWRKIDATPNKDDGTIRTIRTDGYHRTETEMGYKNNFSQQTYAANIIWNFGHFHIGGTGLFTRFNRDLRPDTRQRYRQYYASGNDFWNASVNYGYNSGQLNINGETATGGSGGVATINTISYRPSARLQLKAIQRFYSYRYYSLYSNSLSSGGRIQNESAVLVGATWLPKDGLQLGGYFDYAYHPWARYGSFKKSNQTDLLLTAQYKTGRWTLNGKYRMRKQQKDNSKKTDLIWKTDHRPRLSATYNAKNWWTTTQADGCISTYKVKSRGWMVAQHGGISAFSDKLNASASLAYFDTDDYQSAIYSYERGPRYAFSFPSFYGRGIRYAMMLRYQPMRQLVFLAKLGTTDYFDRDHISSGRQMINHSSKTDLELQLTVKL